MNTGGVCWEPRVSGKLGTTSVEIKVHLLPDIVAGVADVLQKLYASAGSCVSVVKFRHCIYINKFTNTLIKTLRM